MNATHACMFDVHGRIKCGTIAAPDFNGSLADWTSRLGLEVAQEGRLPAELAASWGTPRLLGARTALLRPKSGTLAFVRLVEQPAVLAHLPLRTYGWAGFEIAVRDVHLAKSLIEGSGFRIIGEPKPVDGIATFTPLQVIGRAGEVIYFNATPEASPDLDVPRMRSDVDRVVTAILAAIDRAKSVAFQVEALGFEEGETYVLPFATLNAAFDLPPEHSSMVTATHAGRLPVCEIGQYPADATPRMQLPGYLQPGNSMASYCVASLDRVDAPFIAPPVRVDAPLYEGRRTACVTGAAGEIVELIEVG